MGQKANRSDYSDYLVHFTSNSITADNDEDNPANQYAEMTAKERLLSILDSQKIVATTLKWVNSDYTKKKARAVSFTECPWSSLLAHTQEYSEYGIGFNKALIYSKDGAPAIYVRFVHMNKQQLSAGWHEHIRPFLTPFSPSYRPKTGKKSEADYPECDYSDEREWRVPHDFPFTYKDIKFIILPTYDDMAKFPSEYKDAIGRQNFILMDNFRTIETLWPTHKF